MTERLGRYQLIRSLAAGGMGEIFLAEHTGIAGFAKRVALKRIRPEFARDRAYVQLFLNEARLGSFLNHPNIVHIFDVGYEGDALWLVMEYVDGIDLKRLARRATLAGHPLRPELLAAVMIEVLAALEEAHAGGPSLGAPIIHRDMSPENVLVARTGAVKVLDFGLAKWVPDQQRVPSLEGNMIFGKVRYMPPEQLKGHLIDPRADLFALGVVMYEVLHGDLPFGRGTANQVLAAILAGRPPSPTSRHGTDRELDAIIYRALEPNPASRYQSAEEMRLALVGYLRQRADSLPMEALRKKLRRGAVLGAPFELAEGSPAPAPDDDLGFSVAERCGKCGGPFTAHFLEGLIADRCTSCRGVWLDRAEVDRILGMNTNSAALTPAAGFEQAPLDTLLGSCPTCRVGLHAHDVPGKPASLEICGHCHGIWFDRGELSLLGDEAVVAWLRGVLEAMDALAA